MGEVDALISAIKNIDEPPRLVEHEAMIRTLLAPRWKLVSPTLEGLSILRATGPTGHDLYTVASPYQKAPFLAPKPRWTWTRPRSGERPVFVGFPYDQSHVRTLHSWFLDIPALYEIGFTTTMGVFLDYEGMPFDEEDASLRLADAAQLHEDTCMHHADWRSRS